jgi:hypothetical protein
MRPFRITVLALAVAAPALPVVAGAESGKRIALTYAFQVPELPAEGLLRIIEVAVPPFESLPELIAAEVGAGPEQVWLAGGSATFGPPTPVELGGSAGPGYRVRLCRGASREPVVDEVIPTTGATLLVAQRIGPRFFVLAVEERMVPHDFDIVEAQREQRARFEEIPDHVDQISPNTLYRCEEED